MTHSATSRIDDYLSDLDDALARLPPDRRNEIVRDIRGHIDAALADADDATPATADGILDRLGSPAEIAAAADEYPAVQRPRLRTSDIVTVRLLLIGGVVVPIIGWLVGVALLWMSDTWQRRDKVIGTVLLPGGLLIAVLFGLLPIGSTRTGGCTGDAVEAGRAAACLVPHCTSAATTSVPVWLGITLVLGAAAIPIWTACWLVRQARRSIASDGRTRPHDLPGHPQRIY